MIRHPAFPALAVMLGAAVWGLYWLPMRGISGLGLSASWSVVVLNAPALALASLVIVLSRHRLWLADRRAWVAGLCLGAGFALYAVALVETSVVRATLLFYLTPIWGTILGAALLGERVDMQRIVALAMALAGLVLTLGLSRGDLGATLGLGELLGLLSGLAWAFGAVAVRKAGDIPAVATGFTLYAGALLCALILAPLLGHARPSMDQVEAATQGAVAFYALLVLGGFYVISWAMGRMSPGRSGLLMMTEVVVAVISAALLLPEEALSPAEWLGAALILAAAVLEAGPPVRARAPS